jgi:hypothetical protein
MTHEMKISLTLAICMAIVQNSAAGQTTADYDIKCGELSREHPRAFEGTTFWGRKPFESHPNVSSSELNAITNVFHLGQTIPTEARTWFREQNIPVASKSYQGCVEGYHYSSFARKIDDHSWLVFTFGGGSNGLANLLRGERLLCIDLVRRKKQYRWIENIVPTHAYYNENLFKKGEPNEEWLQDEEVKVECDL